MKRKILIISLLAAALAIAAVIGFSKGETAMGGFGKNICIYQMQGNKLHVYSTIEIENWMVEEIAKQRGVDTITSKRYSLDVEISPAYIQKTNGKIINGVKNTVGLVIFAYVGPPRGFRDVIGRLFFHRFERQVPIDVEFIDSTT